MPRILLFLLLLAGSAAAHPGKSPSVWIDVDVRNTEVELRVTIEIGVLGTWLGRTIELERPEGENAAILTGLAKKLGPVEINGVVVAPIPKGLIPPPALNPANRYFYLEARYVYPCAARPRRVEFIWSEFKNTHWQDTTQVPGLLKAGPDMQVFAFTPDEPGYVWHPPEFLPRTRPPRPEPPSHTAMIVVLVLAGGLALLRRRLLFSLAGLGCWAVALGLWLPPLMAMPSPEQADRLFRQLHQNIYDAFGERTEEGIYDLLALSVDDTLLNKLYSDIFESLILREQGGAITKVLSVEMLDTKVTLHESEKSFDVDAKWKVNAAVSHWGHTHRRINTYEAVCTVRFDGRDWRISSFDVRKHERQDLGATVDDKK